MDTNKRFGILLSEGISSVAKRQNRKMGEIEQEIAERIGYSQRAIQTWRQGKSLSKISEVVDKLVSYCVSNGRVDQVWTESMLRQARHHDPKKIVAQLFPGQSSPTPPENSPPGVQPSHLESPYMIVTSESAFYIERPSDKVAIDSIVKPGGKTIIIKGPPQMGKSSLLGCIAETAKRVGKEVAWVDFELFDEALLEDSDAFFRQFCTLLTYLVGTDKVADQVETYWQVPVGNRQLCTRYLSLHLLKQLDRPLVLAMDNVDTVFSANFRNDFFGMLRAWHNSRAQGDPVWQKLDLVLVTSTEPYLYIDDMNESPFNVGVVVEMEDFTLDQVIELNRKHASPLSTEQVGELFKLLEGHPYLTRKALYLVAKSAASAAFLFNDATKDRGPFGEHLRHMLVELRRQNGLIKSLQQTLAEGACSEETFFRLRGAGLVKRGADGVAVLPRCKLYADFLRRYGHD